MRIFFFTFLFSDHSDELSDFLEAPTQVCVLLLKCLFSLRFAQLAKCFDAEMSARDALLAQARTELERSIAAQQRSAADADEQRRRADAAEKQCATLTHRYQNQD